MEKPEYQNILGKLIVISILLYFTLHYHYQMTDFLLGRWLAWWSWYDHYIHSWWADEDAVYHMNLFVYFFKLILYFIILIILAIVVLITAGPVYIIGALSRYYILPCVIPFFVIYSKFSYAVMLKPLIGLSLIIKSIFSNLLNFFILFPLAHFFSLKHSGISLRNRLVPLFFPLSALLMVIGLAGLSKKAITDQKPFSKLGIVIKPAKETYNQIRTTTVILQASKPFWTDTNVILERGDSLVISAEGKIVWDKQVNVWTGPEGAGWNPERLPRPKDFLLRDWPMVGLMGKIGFGRPFYIGKGIRIKAEDPGILKLAINERWLEFCWEDNSGFFKVQITVKQ